AGLRASGRGAMGFATVEGAAATRNGLDVSSLRALLAGAISGCPMASIGLIAGSVTSLLPDPSLATEPAVDAIDAGSVSSMMVAARSVTIAPATDTAPAPVVTRVAVFASAVSAGVDCHHQPIAPTGPSSNALGRQPVRV